MRGSRIDIMTSRADIVWDATHALSVRQPWADAILFSGKTVENRTWPLPNRWVGQRLWLHAGKRMDAGAPRIADVAADRRGAVIGQVEFGNPYLLSEADAGDRWVAGPWCWPILVALPLDRPIPGPGRLAVFPVFGIPPRAE